MPLPKIALIEDNDDNRAVVVALLEDDFEIDEYEDGFSALEGMPSKEPELILIDIAMPGLDGKEVLKRLKEGPLADTPTIALTAHAMDGDRDTFLAAGFDGYMSKPIVDEDILIELIQTLIQERKSGGAP